jgi:hypothetical protein
MAGRPIALASLSASAVIVIMSLAGAVEGTAQQARPKDDPAKLGVPGPDEALHLKEDAAKAAERAIEVTQSGGCVVRRTFLLSNKTEFTDEHCVAGKEKCTSSPGGYCFDYGIVDPTVLSKSCTPVSQCPAAK